jgi:hypothetical protein
VSWKWGASGRPSGEVAEVATEGELSVTSNKGNVIKKNADPEDPAVHIARSGNDVVKRAHEVDVEEKANGDKPAEDETAEEEEEEEEEEEKEPMANGAATENGDASKKHDLEDEKEDKEDEANGKKDDKKPAAKKQKTDSGKKKKDEDDESSKKIRGRPKNGKSNGTAKGPAKKKEPKPAATADGKPRRSARNRG